MAAAEVDDVDADADVDVDVVDVVDAADVDAAVGIDLTWLMTVADLPQMKMGPTNPVPEPETDCSAADDCSDDCFGGCLTGSWVWQFAFRREGNPGCGSDAPQC